MPSRPTTSDTSTSPVAYTPDRPTDVAAVPSPLDKPMEAVYDSHKLLQSKLEAFHPNGVKTAEQLFSQNPKNPSEKSLLEAQIDFTHKNLLLAEKEHDLEKDKSLTPLQGDHIETARHNLGRTPPPFIEKALERLPHKAYEKARERADLYKIHALITDFTLAEKHSKSLNEEHPDYAKAQKALFKVLFEYSQQIWGTSKSKIDKALQPYSGSGNFLTGGEYHTKANVYDTASYYAKEHKEDPTFFNAVKKEVEQKKGNDQIQEKQLRTLLAETIPLPPIPQRPATPTLGEAKYLATWDALQQAQEGKDKKPLEKAKKEHEKAAWQLVGREPDSSLITQAVHLQSETYQKAHPRDKATDKGWSLGWGSKTTVTKVATATPEPTKKEALTEFGTKSPKRPSLEGTAQATSSPTRPPTRDR